MTGFTRFAVALPIMTALLSGTLTARQATNDNKAVRGVLENYVVGWREADLDKLGHVFASNGMIMWVSEGSDAEILNTLTFEQSLSRGWTLP